MYHCRRGILWIGSTGDVLWAGMVVIKVLDALGLSSSSPW